MMTLTTSIPQDKIVRIDYYYMFESLLATQETGVRVASKLCRQYEVKLRRSAFAS